jgi:hypothetical protein
MARVTGLICAPVPSIFEPGAVNATRLPPLLQNPPGFASR